MIEFKKYSSLRLKLLEGCQLSCRFCHHEGNDAAKLVKVDEVLRATKQLRQMLGLDKIHLTGGEPTLYPHLLDLGNALASNGFRTAITSHGLFSEKIFQHLYHLMTQGDLEYINFSIHTLDPTQYLIINNMPQTDAQYREAQNALNIITEHAIALSQIGTVNINCVVAQDQASLNDMFTWARQHNLTLRLVPDWTALAAAHQTIGQFLHQN
jgi:molybdenum cofactor biosynthesis enzyme MoaA